AADAASHSATRPHPLPPRARLAELAALASARVGLGPLWPCFPRRASLRSVLLSPAAAGPRPSWPRSPPLAWASGLCGLASLVGPRFARSSSVQRRPALGRAGCARLRCHFDRPEPVRVRASGSANGGVAWGTRCVVW